MKHKLEKLRVDFHLWDIHCSPTRGINMTRTVHDKLGNSVSIQMCAREFPEKDNSESRGVFIAANNKMMGIQPLIEHQTSGLMVHPKTFDLFDIGRLTYLMNTYLRLAQDIKLLK